MAASRWPPECLKDQNRLLRHFSNKRRQAVIFSNIKFGLLNSRSDANKAFSFNLSLIKDSMHDGAFDILVLTETWIPTDAPGSIAHSLAPDSFITVHRHLQMISGEAASPSWTDVHRHWTSCSRWIRRPPPSNYAIISSGQFGKFVQSSPSTQLLPLYVQSCSLSPGLLQFPSPSASLIHSL